MLFRSAAFTAESYREILNLLSMRRREKAERYRTREAAFLSAGAGYLLHCALKERGLSEQDAKYSFGEHGKPYIEGFHFNLSHSGTVAVLAVASGEVGVDIQKIAPVREELVKRVCTEREYAYLNHLSHEERERGFFRLWTAKESAGKFLGTGVTDPKKFEINLLSHGVTRGGETIKAKLKEYPFDGYILTVCADGAFAKELKEVAFTR